MVLMESPRLCPMCREEPTWDAHHFIDRVYWRRECFWDKRNGLGIGRKCHKNPARVKEWLRENRPEQYAWLERQIYIIRTGPKPPPLIDPKERRRFFVKIRESLLKQGAGDDQCAVGVTIYQKLVLLHTEKPDLEEKERRFIAEMYDGLFGVPANISNTALGEYITPKQMGWINGIAKKVNLN